MDNEQALNIGMVDARAEIARLTAEVARINAERSDDITIAVMAERQRIKDELLDRMAAAERERDEAQKELAALLALCSRSFDWISKQHEMPGYSELLSDLQDALRGRR